MCMFCNDVTSGKPGVMFKDAKGNFCSLVWFEYEQMPELHIKSDGSFAYVQVFNCPICGRFAHLGLYEMTRNELPRYRRRTGGGERERAGGAG